jgi:tetratricopeptide (TPR) repeat protein
MTDRQIAEFNSFYELGCKQMKGLILIGNYRPKRLWFFDKLKARNAIKSFEQALSIIPDHFQSLFFIGKLYQRLTNYDIALSYFEHALKVEQVNHNIPQEASLVAMHLNQLDKGLEYSKEALKRKPDDIALLGNHSMNLLIAGLDKEAKETIDKAISLSPDDNINNKIKDKIEAVIAGQIRRPIFKEASG